MFQEPKTITSSRGPVGTPVRHQISSLPGTPLENIRSEMSAAGRKDPLLNNPKAKMYLIELAQQSHPLGLAGRRMALA